MQASYLLKNILDFYSTFRFNDRRGAKEKQLIEKRYIAMLFKIRLISQFVNRVKHFNKPLSNLLSAEIVKKIELGISYRFSISFPTWQANKRR